ncbi:MAG TPA: hypothetical protein VNW72_02400 [Chthoniobacterales bacterium]|nr:hypothetical protein [Chthoniobacterales bacterium]
MADSNEPKKETAHITVSSRPSSPPSQPAESRPTVRIHLPTRPPANPPPVPADLSSSARVAAAAMAAPMTTPAPKKETAHMTVLPDPQPKPAVQMKKTQPLIDLQAMETPATAVTLAPASLLERQPRIDQVSMPLCWTLLAASVAILILQIWNYVS